jgi:phosphatidylserine/phosphatidylglycerophosphate/cardiolipin synthase-like enzyme
MKRHIKLLLLILGACLTIAIACIIFDLNYNQPPPEPIDLNTALDTSFGKTHFIIGQPASCPISARPAAIKKAAESATPEQQNAEDVNFATLLHCGPGGIKQALFSPDNDLETVLINLIAREQEALKIAVYSFTNGAIANAVLQAHQRGIHIELIIDASTLRDRFNKIELLQEQGIKPHVYKPTSAGMINDIMHNKFVIFRKNIGNKSLLWTGSFNFTKSAQLKNQENVVIIDDPCLIEKYERQFEVIKARVGTKTKVAQKKRRSRAIPEPITYA